MKIYFVTGNSVKFESAKRLLAPEIEVIQSEIDLTEPQTDDQEYVALFKVRQACEFLKKPVMVSDNGIYIKKYNNFPGVFTKFIVSGIGLSGIEKLIDEAEPAYYKFIFAYKDKDREFLVKSIMPGTLTKTRQSKNINPHAPFKSIFIPENENRVIADLPTETVDQLPFHHQIYLDFKTRLLCRHPAT